MLTRRTSVTFLLLVTAATTAYSAGGQTSQAATTSSTTTTSKVEATTSGTKNDPQPPVTRESLYLEALPFLRKRFSLGADVGDAPDAAVRAEIESAGKHQRDVFVALTGRWLESESKTWPNGDPPNTARLEHLAFLLNEIALATSNLTPEERDLVFFSLSDNARAPFCTAAALVAGVTEQTAGARLAKLPADARRRALAAERVVIDRLGKSSSAGQRPTMELGARLTTFTADARQRKDAGVDPIPPAWVREFGRWQSGDVTNTDFEAACAGMRWWIGRIALRPLAERSGDVLALTFQTIDGLLESELGIQTEALQANGYPGIAAAFGVEGKTRVRVTVDAHGQVQSADVIARHVQVPGLGSAEPVAFDRLFDAPSVEMAFSRDYSKLRKPGADASAQPITTEFDIAWKLE